MNEGELERKVENYVPVVVGSNGNGAGVGGNGHGEHKSIGLVYVKKKWDWKSEIEENKYMSPIQRRIIERLHDPSYVSFRLDSAFVAKYHRIKPSFGFNGLGELAYMRTYSRPKDDGTGEMWPDTVERVVNGTYNLQKRWISERGLEWSDYKAQESAQEMYDRIFHMKFTPPGRGLWAMGSEITEERGLYAALNNCAFVSTENLKEDVAKPFAYLMDMSMVGVGVGFDTRGAGQLVVKGPDKRRTPEFFDIPDTREGWVESVRRSIESYFLGISPVNFGYNKIRKHGLPINGFGGESSGFEVLRDLHKSLESVLDKEIGRPISDVAIVDIQNLIGKCVIAGNVRRTAEIAFGDPHSEEFLDLKNYVRNPHRKEYGWTSNNSVFADLGMDYNEIEERIRDNGEPGLAWLENMRKFGRMSDLPNNKDAKAKGGNPCLEQTLESYELCNLVEVFPNRNKNKEDFLRTLKFAYLYAKTVGLGESHWAETNRILLRNRRIGCSVTGLAQFITGNGLGELRTWLREGYDVIQHYDEVYSNWFTIPKSIKTTSVKPSGTVSLLAGSTPGVHYPPSDYYIRRMRVGRDSELVQSVREAGYKVEDDKVDPSSFVIEVPVHAGAGIRSENNVSMWEQFSLAAFVQEHWADNQVSCTIKFDPKTEGHQIAKALDYYQWRLKGISMLPKKDDAYEQMPYEPITREQYIESLNKIKPLDFSNVGLVKERVEERYCTTETCELRASSSLK